MPRGARRRRTTPPAVALARETDLAALLGSRLTHLQSSIVSPRRTSLASTMDLPSHPSRIPMLVNLPMMESDTPGREHPDTLALLDPTSSISTSRSSTSSSPTLAPPVAVATDTSSPQLSPLSRTLDTLAPTPRAPRRGRNVGTPQTRMASLPMSTPEPICPGVTAPMIPTRETGCPCPRVRLSSPCTPRLLLRSRATQLPRLLTSIQVRCPPQPVVSRSSRCTPRTPRMAEVSIQAPPSLSCRISCFPRPFPPTRRQWSDSLVSPASQPPQGYAPQGQQYGDGPNPRSSVPPSSAVPTPSGATKRRSDLDDDRHTPTDRNPRQPRR